MTRASAFILTVFAFVFSVLQSSAFPQTQDPAYQDPEDPGRNPQAVEILRRAIQAAGGPVVLAEVHDITETGQITFHWSESATGPATIQMLGANHFRLDYEVQGHKTVRTVSDGFGLEQTEAKKRSIPHTRAINLGNLTFPIGHSMAAIADPQTQISFVDIEKHRGRSAFRVRLSGNLGLAAKANIIHPVTKELIIDALTYDVVSVEDQPLPPVTGLNSAKHHVAQRQIEYGDFRWVNGVRMPFSISIRIAGQKATTILLNDISFNSNLRDDDFRF